ncbi:transposase [Acidaminococcus intestini]|jgi:transposase|uniref:transposase n=1 Tax=Acidaminococcus sp. AM33-14BH TaxID=2292909 RepID=UPI001A9FCAE4
MKEINVNKFLSDIPSHKLGRIRYNPVNMLKTVLFGFMDEGYISLRKLEDNCKVNLRYQYLMDGKKPSYRIFWLLYQR